MYSFERDAEGRITEFRDPMDVPMSYGYDAAGDLVSFTYRENHTSYYFYGLAHDVAPGIVLKDP